jgi:hypothetical protein
MGGYRGFALLAANVAPPAAILTKNGCPPPKLIFALMPSSTAEFSAYRQGAIAPSSNEGVFAV